MITLKQNISYSKYWTISCLSFFILLFKLKKESNYYVLKIQFCISQKKKHMELNEFINITVQILNLFITAAGLSLPIAIEGNLDILFHLKREQKINITQLRDYCFFLWRMLWHIFKHRVKVIDVMVLFVFWYFSELIHISFVF